MTYRTSDTLNNQNGVSVWWRPVTSISWLTMRRVPDEGAYVHFWRFWVISIFGVIEAAGFTVRNLKIVFWCLHVEFGNAFFPIWGVCPKWSRKIPDEGAYEDTPLRLGFFSTILDIRPYIRPFVWDFFRPFWTYALYTPLRLGFFPTILDIRPTYAPSSRIFLDHFWHTPYIRPFVWDFFPPFLTYDPHNTARLPTWEFQWTLFSWNNQFARHLQRNMESRSLGSKNARIYSSSVVRSFTSASFTWLSICQIPRYSRRRIGPESQYV